jgi:DNA modification methylase
MTGARILVGDVRESLRGLPDGSVRCVVTSPPYWGLRDYGHDGQIGLENTSELYVAEMVGVFREVRRVLADDGTLWLNLGDTYGSGKQLVGIPWRVAFALQADGWYLRQDIIWAKPNPMPESVKDRCTKAHEYLFLLTKQPRYYYDPDAAAEPIAESSRKRYQHAVDSNEHFDPTRHKHTAGVQSPMELLTRAASGVLERGTRNRRTVWNIPVSSFLGAHFAVMPEALVETCVLSGSARGDTVLDPFSGSGTVGVVALKHERNYIGCELNPEYADLSRKRILDDAPLMNTVEVS